MFVIICAERLVLEAFFFKSEAHIRRANSVSVAVAMAYFSQCGRLKEQYARKWVGACTNLY